MKRLWIVAGILLFLVGVSVAGLVHLDYVTDEMVASLDRISTMAETRQSAHVNELIADFGVEWRKNEDVMVRYLHHDALDSVTGFVALLPALARYEQYPQLAAELERIRALLLHIREAEIPNWKNIF